MTLPQGLLCAVLLAIAGFLIWRYWDKIKAVTYGGNPEPVEHDADPDPVVVKKPKRAKKKPVAKKTAKARRR